MPYETPADNTSVSVATISVRDMSVDNGAYTPQINLTTGQFGAGEATDEEVADMVQKIIDAVNGHTDLVVTDASRTYRVDQNITPA
jgi:Holliday junction resolvasome RuvABC endonuclease subunit